MTAFWFIGGLNTIGLTMMIASGGVVVIAPVDNPLCPECQMRYGHGSWCSHRKAR